MEVVQKRVYIRTGKYALKGEAINYVQGDPLNVLQVYSNDTFTIDLYGHTHIVSGGWLRWVSAAVEMGVTVPEPDLPDTADHAWQKERPPHTCPHKVDLHKNYSLCTCSYKQVDKCQMGVE